MFSGVEKNALSWFSNLSLVDHGYYLPVDPSIVQLDDFLGTGATSKVYHGTLPENNKSVVVKIMTNREQVKKENKNLQELKDVPTVPKIVRVLENGLILKPCAFKLEVFQLHPEIKHGIVDTLYEADSRGLVHRDIRNEHLFTTTGNSVLVNDWGSAIPKGEHTGYPGAVKEGSPSALLVKKAPTAVPNDDLHALARTMYCKLYNPPTNKLPNTSKELSTTEYQKTLKKIQEFWDQTKETNR